MMIEDHLADECVFYYFERLPRPYQSPGLALNSGALHRS